MGKRKTQISSPANMRIWGNERADEVAKEAVKWSCVEREVRLSKSEEMSIVWRKAIERWQQNWDAEGEGKHFFFFNFKTKDGQLNKKGT